MNKFKKSIVIFVLNLMMIFLTSCSVYNSDYLKSKDYDMDFYMIEDYNEMKNEFRKFKYNIDSQMGKSIRVAGEYFKIESPYGGYYHFIFVGDNLDSNLDYVEIVYEGEYPEDDKIISISGVVDQYDEDGMYIMYVKVDTMKILQ